MVYRLLLMGNKRGIGTLVTDSNKFLTLVPAVFAFIWFKNLKIGYSKGINTVAVFIVCMVIDMIRIRLLERPFMKWVERVGQVLVKE